MIHHEPYIRVFPRRTSYTPADEMAFVGDPPLFRPEAHEVHISVAFTWDIVEANRLAEAWGNYYGTVKIGGPALGTACLNFGPGVYVKPGVTFTTRGCNHRCPWCLVPDREGALAEIANFAPGWIVQDNNLLQASRRHIEQVFDMLRKQPSAATFAGGLDARLIDDWVAEQLRGLRIAQLFLAADVKGALKPLEHAIKRLAMPRWKVRVYTMLAYNSETMNDATQRLKEVWKLGGVPFAQLYQPPDHWIDYGHEWRSLARTWSRPAATAALMGGW